MFAATSLKEGGFQAPSQRELSNPKDLTEGVFLWERRIFMQYKEVTGGICAPKGFAAAGVNCGIRANHTEKYDLALIKAEVRCAAAGV